MSKAKNRPLQVFLCHASQDKPIVRELYHRLRAEGIDAWLDEHKIIAGQEWKIEIPKAIRESDAVVVCLSKNSITKEGYIQKEIKQAIDIAEEKPPGMIFIIPARLVECSVPEPLNRWQWADLFREEYGDFILLRALELRASQLGTKISHKPLPEEILPIPRDFQTWGGMKFIKIPAGSFTMGSKLANEYANENENPQHIVDIPYDYWIGRFPLKNEQFEEFVKSTGYVFKWIDGWKRKLDHPVVAASWYDAQAYLKWLNGVFGDQLQQQELIFRLPTEAEWEKAARGGDDRKWPWGNKFDTKKCNSFDSNKNTTSSVGAYSPHGDSPFGVADMAGNVLEWTNSILKIYPYRANDGREKSSGKDFRVLRGGSFEQKASFVRAACRVDVSPDLASMSSSFRVAIAPPISHL